ncbi:MULTISPECIES: ATP-binding cassette domain-containing protein [Streptomyces]|uniref:ABC-type xenobiotic transporter n=2 Tax=Streptomyces TaxID=1883 RepID=A0A7K3RAV6_STRAQ|nr:MULTISPECIES: ATP-binding cassette domain-containing protein [Streptomyces]NDZ58371.1 ATP-binding cassette domain-containing protein [Streptomyces anulatus]NEB99329.1 ATP-binding cassette domain-containing protein [Streptomyces anulatus]NED24924.1 ATP-binding cassette domain-containing protein [Streptomyces anulatus]OLO31984.1 daunorubicin/doxorubicin resistance ABC transporter ATP-binding protein DrrA [Streptomyces sp. MNU77]
MDIAIQAEGLRKRYGGKEIKNALNGVDLIVPAGTVFGLLGPNGAGKTTTVRILATLLTADEGEATVAGFDVRRQSKEVRRRIGLTGQYAAVDERLTGRENLRLIGTLYHLGKTATRARADELLELLDLTDAANRAVKTYSGGMRRRLDLAASLIAEPPVLFLDEPTTGLDLTSRLTLWDVIRTQVGRGVTVLLTTQYLEEADQLADRIAVIDDGAVVAEGTPDQLKDRVGDDRMRVTAAKVEDLTQLTKVLGRFTTDQPLVDEEQRTVSVPMTDGIGGIASVSAELAAAGIPVSDFQVSRPSMDEVFLSLTNKAATRPENEGAAA